MTQPLSIAFIWHMHQPYYRDLATGACSMPWVRLHAAKDYVDMVARLKAYPAIHQTVNIVPSLLDQLQAYLPPSNGSDIFLDLSRKPAAELTTDEQRFVLQWFFLANRAHMIAPYPRYRDLLAKRGDAADPEALEEARRRFRPQDYRDLQVWFNLAWIDPWLRTQEPALAQVTAKDAHFTEEDKQRVLEAQLALVARVIPTYRAMAERGQIELSTSPYYHPILPLLCDLQAARAALPQLPLPQHAFRHPEDARWQIREGLVRHAEVFGKPPEGLWPSEGSVSEEAVAAVMDAGIRWIATDEEILWRTVRTSRDAAALYRPHAIRRPQGELAVLFRDRELSDLIGFVYNRWRPQEAVADFLRRLGAIHEQRRSAPEPPLVTVILDGENAWESYPEDGQIFLSALYDALAGDSRFQCVTVSEFLSRYPLDRAPSLPPMHSGSWIDANLATWIGHPEKNAAWDQLALARDALAPLREDGRLDPAAWRSFCIAEGSDWMWWFGDTHFSAQADEFDRLFRAHLANSYRLAGLPVPDALDRPIRRPEQGTTSAPTGWIRPTIDGRESSYYEWLFAGRLSLTSPSGAMQPGAHALHRLHFGSDGRTCFLRVDVDHDALARLAGWSIGLSLGPIQLTLRPDAEGHVRAESEGGAALPIECAGGRLIELAVPLSLLGVAADDPLPMSISLAIDGKPLERYPATNTVQLLLAPADGETRGW